jgi:hypothetical protein
MIESTIQGASMRTRRPADPPFRAILRARIERAVFKALLLLLILGLLGCGISLASLLSDAFALTTRVIAGGLFVVCIGAMIGVMCWLLGLLERDRGDWTDGLKGVVPLDDFLRHDPADRTLAPNEDEEIQTALLTNLAAIAAREDVLEVSVGVHDEEGYVSDQVHIKTYAPGDVICEWQELLHTEEFWTILTLRYEVDGRRRKVRHLLFTWD